MYIVHLQHMYCTSCFLHRAFTSHSLPSCHGLITLANNMLKRIIKRKLVPSNCSTTSAKYEQGQLRAEPRANAKFRANVDKADVVQQRTNWHCRLAINLCQHMSM